MALDLIGVMEWRKTTKTFENFSYSNEPFLAKNIQDFSPGGHKIFDVSLASFV